MSNKEKNREPYITITPKGYKLIRSKFGIPYGLILAMLNPKNWFLK